MIDATDAKFERTRSIRDVSRGTGHRENHLPGGSLTMSAKGRFLVYCLELYRKDKNLTGKQVLELFRQYGINQYELKPDNCCILPLGICRIALYAFI